MSCTSPVKVVDERVIQRQRTVIDPKTVATSELQKWRKTFTTSKQNDKPSIAFEITENPEKTDLEQLKEEAMALLQRGDVAKAEAYFNQIVRLSPNDDDALLNLASIHIERDEIDEAFVILMELKKKQLNATNENPTFITKYRYTLAIAHIKRGETSIGHSYLSKLIAADTTFTPAYLALARSYLRQNKVSTAEFITKRGIDQGGDDPKLFNVLGLISRQKGDLEDAERWFNKSIDLAPNDVKSLVNRASVNVIRFEYDAATRDLGQALSINPLSIDALMLAGFILNKQEQYIAAKDILTKAISLDPENPSARFNLALIEEKLDNKTSARRLIEEVLQLENKDTHLYKKAKLKLVDLAPALD